MSIAASTDLLQDAEKEIARLRVLVEASKLINSSIEGPSLYHSFLAVAQKQLSVERGTLYFVDEERREIRAAIKSQLETGELRLKFGQGIAGTVAESGESVIIDDAYRDRRFNPSVDIESGFRTTSMLCVPIRNRDGRVVGVLQLLNKTTGPFGEDDLEFLESISDHMAIAMENAMLHLSLVEKKRMEEELRLGREIQARLLPPAPDDVPHTRISARSISCYEVGGDYYDFIPLARGELGIAIGDVSGKGVSAALVMSSVQAALRASAPLKADLVELVQRLNDLLVSTAHGRKYLTFFFASYDPQTAQLRFVNAGHCPPLLCQAGSTQILESTGRPIGLFPEIDLVERIVDFPPGACLVLYTDGLPEAANPADEELGMPRWRDLVLAHSSLEPEAMIERLLDEVVRYEAGAPTYDDKTIVVLRRAEV